MAKEAEPKRRSRSTEPSEQSAENSLGAVLKAYESKPHTPELLTATFKFIWKDRGVKVADLLEKPLVPVIRCDRTKEEIKALEKAGRRLAYLPPELATQENRHILGVMFPEMQNYSVQEGNSVTNEQVRSGWFDYEAAIDAPYLNTTEDQLGVIFADQNRLGMNATEYVIAGQDSKLFAAKHLDQGSTKARLLGSRDRGRVLAAYSSPIGHLHVRSGLRSSDRNGKLGGRSVGVK